MSEILWILPSELKYEHTAYTDIHSNGKCSSFTANSRNGNDVLTIQHSAAVVFDYTLSTVVETVSTLC